MPTRLIDGTREASGVGAGWAGGTSSRGETGPVLLRIYVRLGQRCRRAESRSAAAPGAVRRPPQILNASDAFREGKGLKVFNGERNGASDVGDEEVEGEVLRSTY